MAYLGNFDIYRCDQCGYEIHVKSKRDINTEGWFYQWWTEDKDCLCPKCKND